MYTHTYPQSHTHSLQNVLHKQNRMVFIHVCPWIYINMYLEWAGWHGSSRTSDFRSRDLCIYACTHIWVYIHIYVHMCAYIYIRMYTYILNMVHDLNRGVFLGRLPSDFESVCLYVCTHIYVYIHVYMHIYVHVFTHIHMFAHIECGERAERHGVWRTSAFRSRDCMEQSIQQDCWRKPLSPPPFLPHTPPTSHTYTHTHFLISDPCSGFRIISCTRAFCEIRSLYKNN